MNFSGRLGAQTYTDPALFALDAKAHGLARPVASAKLDRGRTAKAMTTLTAMERDWLGAQVRTPDGRIGQVWSLSWARNGVAVVLPSESGNVAETFAAADLVRVAAPEVPTVLA